ncbi:MAG: hypothetical protein ACPLXM_09020 [Bacteroidales bacterium]
MKVRFPVGLKLALAFMTAGIFVLVWFGSVHRIYLMLKRNDQCITRGLVPLQMGITELRYALLQGKLLVPEREIGNSPEH